MTARCDREQPSRSRRCMRGREGGEPVGRAWRMHPTHAGTHLGRKCSGTYSSKPGAIACLHRRRTSNSSLSFSRSASAASRGTRTQRGGHVSACLVAMAATPQLASDISTVPPGPAQRPATLSTMRRCSGIARTRPAQPMGFRREGKSCIACKGIACIAARCAASRATALRGVHAHRKSEA